MSIPKTVRKNIIEKLLRLFQLDYSYVEGKGNSLYYIDENQDRIEVLDLVGSYGTNLLGYQNSKIVNYAQKLLIDGNPVFSQLSANEHLTTFQNYFSQLLHAEGATRDWGFLHSNTGGEAVEAALKTAWLYYHQRREKLLQQINQSLFQIKNNYAQLTPIFVKQLNIQTREAAVQYYTDWQKKIQADPFLLAMRKGYHGKTAGAYAATDSDAYSNFFPVAYQVLRVEEETNFLSQIITKKHH